MTNFSYISVRGSKSFWSFVRRVKDNSSSFPTLVKDDLFFTNPVDKANLLAQMFARNSSLPESNQPLPVIDNVSSSMPQIFFRTRGVKRVLANLDVNPRARMGSQHLSYVSALRR